LFHNVDRPFNFNHPKCPPNPHSLKYPSRGRHQCDFTLPTDHAQCIHPDGQRCRSAESFYRQVPMSLRKWNDLPRIRIRKLLLEQRVFRFSSPVLFSCIRTPIPLWILWITCEYGGKLQEWNYVPGVEVWKLVPAVWILRKYGMRIVPLRTDVRLLLGLASRLIWSGVLRG
jgi:hypothetical protein